VLKQLATRFGILSAAAAQRVRTADAADLERIAERILTAQSLDKTLGEP